MNEALIEVKNIKKTYFRKQDSIEVLRDISFSIRKNESLSITGPSGAGKTTLLHIIAGLQEPTAGQVLFENKSIHAFTEKEIARFRNLRIGFVFQFYHLIEELDVVENVMLPAMVYSQDPALVLRQRAGHLLESLELGKRKDFFPSQLSGGEKQRVAIARALMNKPPLLLCDEPTGNLDFNSAERIIQLLFALKKAENVTLAIVTHNPDLAKKTDRSIHIKNGIITS